MLVFVEEYKYSTNVERGEKGQVLYRQITYLELWGFSTGYAVYE